MIASHDAEGGEELQAESRKGEECGLITIELSTPASRLQVVEETLKKLGYLDDHVSNAVSTEAWI